MQNRLWSVELSADARCDKPVSLGAQLLKYEKSALELSADASCDKESKLVSLDARCDKESKPVSLDDQPGRDSDDVAHC